MIGQSVKRREDDALLRGAGRFVDDIVLPGMAFMALVRSPHARARIRGIDASEAAKHPGVLRIFTADDVRGKVDTVPIVGMPDGVRRLARPLLADGEARFVGEPVVAIVAQDRYVAADACDLVRIDYDPLPAVIDPEYAVRPDAPRVHAQYDDNVAYRQQWSVGDVDGAFASAHAVVRTRVQNQRVAVVPMETRGCVAEHRHAMLTVWAGTQAPHRMKYALATALRLSESRVRIIAPDVGGGFGCKVLLYGDETLCALAAMRIGRPVKLMLTRSEDMLATTQGRGQVNEVEFAVSADGTIQAVRCRTLANLGSYLEVLTAYPGILTGRLVCGPYRIPAAQYELTSVFTNVMATAPYRGAGRPEAAYLLERGVDDIARTLRLDPADVRRRNLIHSHEFPYRAASGYVYDSGQYHEALDRLAEMVHYKAFRATQEEERARGRYLGIGLSTFIETAGVGPSRTHLNVGWESAAVRVEPSGKVTVVTGSSPHGQGLETVFAQIVSDRLAVPIDDVAVLHGDTAMVASGIGTWGSRSVAVGGSAIAVTIGKVIHKGRRVAAALLEAAVEDVAYEGGRFTVRGSPSRSLSLAEVANGAYVGRGLPQDVEPVLEATTAWDPSNFTFPSGAYAAVVEVEPDSGHVRLLRFAGVDDCGRIINPMLVEGQIHGGLAQGIGQALWEEVIYDDAGQNLTGSLMDYAVAKFDSLAEPLLDVIETPSPVNPIGAKGCGETGAIGAPPAIVNAVLDALAPLGITSLDMPLTPARVWSAIQAARAKGRR
jgi:aerobic carbon-monoxide dehydrogenase large subunit